MSHIETYRENGETKGVKVPDHDEQVCEFCERIRPKSEFVTCFFCGKEFCYGCIRRIPLISDVYDALKRRGFEVCDLCLDDPNNLGDMLLDMVLAKDSEVSRLDNLAARAAQTGDIKDLQNYLKERRNRK